MKARTVWDQLPVLELMKSNGKAPKHSDATELPGGGRLGNFWDNCKSKRRCEGIPYNQLLVNPVLRDDYRPHKATQEHRSS